MKRDYSFNEMSNVTMGHFDCENKPTPQPYYPTTKQSNDSWTDLRVQEIKRKYQTSSHRKIPSNFGTNERSRDRSDSQNSNPYNSYRNALRDSLGAQNILKRDLILPSDKQTPSIQQDSQPKSNGQEDQYVPRFNHVAKENRSILDRYSSIKNSTLNKYKELQSNKIDPRVQNIDKINMKIKKILDCLHQNQKSAKDATKEDYCKGLRSSFLKGSALSKGEHSEDLEQTTIISRQRFGIDKQPVNAPMRSSIMKNERYSSPQIKNSSSSKWRLQEKYNNIRNIKTLQNQETNQSQNNISGWFESHRSKDRMERSRSYLGNLKTQEIQLHSGKKLNDEITKINARIKQFEEEKKKLGVQFKPYHYEMKYNRSNSNFGEHVTQRGSKPPLSTNLRNSNQFGPSYQKKYNLSSKIRTEEDQCQTKELLEAKRNISLQQFKQQNRINNSLLGIEEQKRSRQILDFKEQSFSIEIDSKPEAAHRQSGTQQLKERTEEGIEERKRKLLQTVTVSFSKQTKRLISNLFEQVKLDEELRNAKIWYRDLLACNKLELLIKQASKAGLTIDQTHLQVTEEEDNPFYSLRESDQSFTCLVDRWMRAEKYWKQQIQGKFNLRQFTAQKFTLEKLDLERKGYFVVEDLVRFLNMQTGTFYRNRDLILILRRISQENKLYWDQFMAVLDEDNYSNLL